MEGNNNKWFILAAIVALIIMTTMIFFEVIDKPVIKWSNKLDLESKSSSGLHLFKSLLETKYNQVKTVESDSLNYLEDEQSTLLIYIANKIVMDDSTYSTLLDYINRGNEALLITSSIRNAKNQSMIKHRYNDSDTSMILTWADSTEYQYKLYYRDVTSPKKMAIKHIVEPYDSLSIYSYEDLLTIQDTDQINYSILIRRNYGDGQLAMHSMPELFTNVTSLQDMYLDNFEKTFNLFKSQKVILHKNISYVPEKNETSPIQYILEEPSLKSAYYLLLFTALLYAIFAAKRKQKPIPTLVENKNTSLTYVKTMSELYKAQDQNEKLVPHMQKIFFNKIKNKYFLDPHSEDFARLLSLKAKVEEEEINKILLKFDSAKSHKFNDDQIINLYNDIISFHKKSN